MPHIFDPALKETIRNRLSAFSRPAETDPAGRNGLKHAAVSIVIVPRMGQAGFLLTRRAPRLGAHAGQWALPGGRLDPGETVIDAARREMREEINLNLGEDAVLGLLDDYPTRSGYHITPVVFWADDLEPVRANPGEVASIHSFPLAELQRKDSPIFLKIPESDRTIIRLLLGKTWRVHAPTGAVLYQFAEVALNDRQTRVAHYDQPVFAWK